MHGPRGRPRRRGWSGGPRRAVPPPRGVGGGVGMAPPPPWVLVVVLWVYTPDGDFSVMPLSTSSIRSSSITTAGTRGGGGGRGWAWGHERGWLHTLLLPHPPPSSLQPHRCLVPRARVWDPYPIGCGMVGCPPRQPGVGGWMGKWGWEGPPLRAAAPLMRATGAEWVMTQWGGQHRAPTASLAAVWCYGGAVRTLPPPPPW